MSPSVRLLVKAKPVFTLTNKLICLCRRLADGDDTVSVSISDTESRLKALHVKEIEGIMICSRAQWLEEGKGLLAKIKCTGY